MDQGTSTQPASREILPADTLAQTVEPVDTVETLRATLSNLISTTGAEIDNQTREIDGLRAGSRLAAEIVAEISRTMSSRLDANSYDFGNSYGAGALERVNETADRLRARAGVQGSIMVSMVEWLLPSLWREAFVDSLRDIIRDEVRDEIRDEIREEIEDEVRDSVRDEVRDALSSVGDALDEIESAVSTVRDAVEEI
jgi:hypothetical protein